MKQGFDSPTGYIGRLLHMVWGSFVFYASLVVMVTIEPRAAYLCLPRVLA